MVRDFFWDDEFRVKWDDMLIHAETLEECPTTGAMVVHWVRKVRAKVKVYEGFSIGFLHWLIS